MRGRERGSSSRGAHRGTATTAPPVRPSGTSGAKEEAVWPEHFQLDAMNFVALKMRGRDLKDPGGGGSKRSAPETSARPISIWRCSNEGPPRRDCLSQERLPQERLQRRVPSIPGRVRTVGSSKPSSAVSRTTRSSSSATATLCPPARTALRRESEPGEATGRSIMLRNAHVLSAPRHAVVIGVDLPRRPRGRLGYHGDGGDGAPARGSTSCLRVGR